MEEFQLEISELQNGKEKPSYDAFVYLGIFLRVQGAC
jgi:hypothetical protein